MRINKQGDILIVQREDGKKVYKDSTFWYYLKKAMQESLRLSLVVATHERDGNMYGDTYYLRTSAKDIQKGVNPYYAVYDNDYAIRSLRQAYNDDEQINLLFVT